MSEDFEYQGVWFQITHLPDVGLYQAVSGREDLPVALTISASTLMGLLHGIKSSVDNHLDAGGLGVLPAQGAVKRGLPPADAAIGHSLQKPRIIPV